MRKNFTSEQMLYTVRLALMIVLASVSTVAYAQDVDWHQAQGLDDGRQWFEEGVRRSSTSSEILRAAEAVAFNRAPAAIKMLRKIINSQPRSNAAHQAYGLLSRVYLRSGQYKRLVENLDAWAAAFPDREEVKRERKDVEQFRGLPDRCRMRREAVQRFGSQWRRNSLLARCAFVTCRLL